MNTRHFRRLTRLSLLPSLFLAAACSDADLPTSEPLPMEATAALAFPGGEALTVLTRNMYMGGDVGLVFGADLNNPAAVAAAATAVWGQIQANRFSERAGALADEIAETRPHVVAIQEIPQYVVINPATGQPVEVQDHLQILLEEMEGLPYEVAALQDNTVAVMPIVLSTGIHYVQYKDRIAVLVRTDLDVTDVASGSYGAYYPLAPGLDLKRGWIRVSADVGGVPYHFVNTHLEVQGFAPIQALQVQELLQSIMADLDGVTVLMGDLNSDAEGGPGDPSWTPSYQTLIDAGFQDTWEISHPGLPHVGFTCCQEKDLLNPVSELEERIDFVLIRSTEHQGSVIRMPGAIHTWKVGENEGDRTYLTGLWPSDHAGLVASLKLPRGIFR